MTRQDVVSQTVAGGDMANLRGHRSDHRRLQLYITPRVNLSGAKVVRQHDFQARGLDAVLHKPLAHRNRRPVSEPHISWNPIQGFPTSSVYTMHYFDLSVWRAGENVRGSHVVVLAMSVP